MHILKRGEFSAVFLILAVLFGVFLRVHELSRQVFWYDETISLLRIAGHTREDTRKSLSSSSTPTSVAELQTFLRPDPTHSTVDDISTIVTQSLTAPNMPCYYVLARIWFAVWGAGSITLRYLSVCLNLGAILCLWYFCRRHFSPPSLARYVTAFALLSPYFIFFSREARCYSFLLLLLVCSAGFLLEYLKTSRRRNLGYFGAVSLLGILSHPLFLATLVAEVFVFSIFAKKKFQSSWKQVALPVLAVILGCTVASPWYVAVSKSAEFLNHGTTIPIVDQSYIVRLGLTLARLVFEPEYLSITYVVQIVLAFGVIATVLGTFLYFARGRSLEMCLVVAWCVLPATLIAFDLVLGGQRALLLRYLFPAALAAVLMCGVVADASATALKRSELFRFALIFLMCVQALSIYRAEEVVEWNRTPRISKDILPIAKLFEQLPDSPILSTIDPIHLLSIAGYLEQDHRVVPTTAAQFSVVAQTLPSGSHFFALLEVNKKGIPFSSQFSCQETFFESAVLSLKGCRVL